MRGMADKAVLVFLARDVGLVTVRADRLDTVHVCMTSLAANFDIML